MHAFLGRLKDKRRAVLLYGLLILVGWALGDQLRAVTIPEMRPMNEPAIHRIVMGALVVYIVTAAIPFVPGAEIGFTLLFLFGAKAAPIVYWGMVGALLLSYGIARLVPLTALARAAAWLGLGRAATFLERFDATPPHERADLLSRRIDSRLGRTLLKNRYLALAILINLPGNSVLGGGGGLAFLAGASGLYRAGPYLLTVLLAVAPFPLGVYLLAS